MAYHHTSLPTSSLPFPRPLTRQKLIRFIYFLWTCVSPSMLHSAASLLLCFYPCFLMFPTPYSDTFLSYQTPNHTHSFSTFLELLPVFVSLFHYTLWCWPFFSCCFVIIHLRRWCWLFLYTFSRQILPRPPSKAQWILLVTARSHDAVCESGSTVCGCHTQERQIWPACFAKAGGFERWRSHMDESKLHRYAIFRISCSLSVVHLSLVLALLLLLSVFGLETVYYCHAGKRITICMFH